MFANTRKEKSTWKELIARECPLQLPAAHDVLTARLIEQAGFSAYQVGGFALDGARFGFPDIDLTRFGEKCAAVREIVAASDLPVLVDSDDGYGDVKNVTHTVRVYEQMGVSAIFIEDQKPPKRCGPSAGKKLVATRFMEEKVRAAVAARRDSEALFVIARTDALEPEGLDEALRRGERYLKSGADGLYIEGPRNMKELKRIAQEFKGVPQIANMLEGGGDTPWLDPEELREMGFAMVSYPTTVLLRMTKAIQRALGDLRKGKAMPKSEGVTMEVFEEIVELPFWAKVESRFQDGTVDGEGGGTLQKLIDKMAG